MLDVVTLAGNSFRERNSSKRRDAAGTQQGGGCLEWILLPAACLLLSLEKAGCS